MPDKKEFATFAPANRKTSTRVKTTIYRVSLKKKVRHVPRHIELTAVLKRDLKNKYKESKRIGRFKKPLEFESNKQRVRFI